MYVKGQTYWHGQLDTGTDLTIEVLIRNIVGLGQIIKDSHPRFTYNTDETLRDPIFFEIHIDWDTDLIKPQKKYTLQKKQML